ncbi:M23 family metallopeptidase [Paenibacillus alginolyticus]|uniref:M23 family metallopeptidase n=1 Tax=Paenibacillus alginolyticus TaxID=59839 RepID=UPI0004179F96|nr:M23 family metallopeptidase [Paenibacillus alginolyticus]MCY9665741.1 M23 family metallopeptidase [Paenibacillus alginolyticus]
MNISSQELGQQAAGQAGKFGKKAGGKLARKAAGKAAKAIKKLVINIVKKFVAAAVKAVIATFGIEIIAVLLALLIFSAILMSISSSDWFLKGGQRNASEESADRRYEQVFRNLADQSVAPIDSEEASESWKETLKNLVKPNWAIPASLARYKISHTDSKVMLPDAKEVFKNLEPTFSYKTIDNDMKYTKSITACYHEESYTDDEGIEHTRTVDDPPTESVSSSKMPARKIMSGVETRYGTTEIPSVKRYFPGGTIEPNGQWEYSGSSSSGNCTTITYIQWEKTMIDDRGVPEIQYDAVLFKNYLISRGVKERNLNEYYEYVKATDPYFPIELYNGKYADSGGGGYSNADYTFNGKAVDGWVWPIAIDYRGINSGFGPRWGTFHYGVDLGGRGWPNAPILAAKDGLVIWAGAMGTYGNIVIIAHDDGLQTRYAHMSSVTVKVSDQVKAGQQIGKQGSTGDSTGPHLHFEVAIPNKKNPFGRMAEAEKAFNPMIFLGPIKDKGG